MCGVLLSLNQPCLELFGTEGVGDILDGVTETVSEVIGGVDAPLVPCSMVGSELDTVSNWVLLTFLQDGLHSQGRLTF